MLIFWDGAFKFKIFKRGLGPITFDIDNQNFDVANYTLTWSFNVQSFT